MSLIHYILNNKIQLGLPYSVRVCKQHCGSSAVRLNRRTLSCTKAHMGSHEPIQLGTALSRSHVQLRCGVDTNSLESTNVLSQFQYNMYVRF